MHTGGYLPVPFKTIKHELNTEYLYAIIIEWAKEGL